MAKNEINNLEDLYSELKKPDVFPNTKFSYTHPKKTKNKSMLLSLGRIWFNLLLPDDFPLVDYAVSKKQMGQIINQIYEKYPPEKAAHTLSVIMKESFKMSSVVPTSFEMDSFIVPQEIKDLKKEKITKDVKPEEFGGILESISKEYISKYLENAGIRDIIESKATGKLNPAALAILMIAKGPTMDIEDNISEPITSSLLDGYTGKEYYAAAAEARRGDYIRSQGTAEPGYLARQVIFANANTEIGVEDCGTNKYFELFVRESIFPDLMGRFYLNERTNKLVEITENSSKIINTTILLRTPLYCKDKTGICKTCYGKLFDRINTKYIGLIAGNVINQAGVEGYSMKARHQATQVNIKPVDFTRDLIHI